MKTRIFECPADAVARFVSRENRFLGVVDITDPQASKGVEVHIRDPGRLKEIIYPGNRILLKEAKSEERKTDWDLLAGRVKDQWVFVNSGYHRQIAEWILTHEAISPFGDIDEYVAEQLFGNSRLDFLIRKNGGQIWVEVKGCTLAKDDVALFPDAPTKRGKRHVKELNRAVEKGGAAGILILVFRRDADCFAPNEATDPRFAAAFQRARANGVKVFPIQLTYEEGSLYYLRDLPLCK